MFVQRSTTTLGVTFGRGQACLFRWAQDWFDLVSHLHVILYDRSSMRRKKQGFREGKHQHL